MTTTSTSATLASIAAMAEINLAAVERKLAAFNAYVESERKRLEAMKAEFERKRAAENER